jgi:hypothetical protein
VEGLEDEGEAPLPGRESPAVGRGSPVVGFVAAGRARRLSSLEGSIDSSAEDVFWERAEARRGPGTGGVPIIPLEELPRLDETLAHKAPISPPCPEWAKEAKAEAKAIADQLRKLKEELPEMSPAEQRVVMTVALLHVEAGATSLTDLIAHAASLHMSLLEENIIQRNEATSTAAATSTELMKLIEAEDMVRGELSEALVLLEESESDKATLTATTSSLRHHLHEQASS